MVCLHGFMDTWRTWELVLPALESRHDVLAVTLAGDAGGPAFDDAVGHAGIVDAVERAMDDAGFEAAHLVGNSLGGYVALQLAARGRATSVLLVGEVAVQRALTDPCDGGDLGHGDGGVAARREQVEGGGGHGSGM